MTDTEPHTPTGRLESMPINPSTAEGRSKLALFVGMGGLALGTMANAPLAVWGSVAVVALAFAYNTAGKLLHYRSLSIPRRDRLALSASWVLLAATVVALLATFATARYGTGDGAFFWSLGTAGVGFGLLHMAAQSRYLADVERPD